MDIEVLYVKCIANADDLEDGLIKGKILLQNVHLHGGLLKVTCTTMYNPCVNIYSSAILLSLNENYHRASGMIPVSEFTCLMLSENLIGKVVPGLINMLAELCLTRIKMSSQSGGASKSFDCVITSTTLILAYLKIGSLKAPSTNFVHLLIAYSILMPIRVQFTPEIFESSKVDDQLRVFTWPLFFIEVPANELLRAHQIA
ncbi:hypothetical protein BD769DRAFT_1382178 [Suillus cothurnatus]|nr:hypothetical protein BD769DRAFT_1382178 [Suillus cothurnatus]